jgi:hypothetical protein
MTPYIKLKPKVVEPDVWPTYGQAPWSHAVVRTSSEEVLALFICEYDANDFLQHQSSGLYEVREIAVD